MLYPSRLADSRVTYSMPEVGLEREYMEQIRAQTERNSTCSVSGIGSKKCSQTMAKRLLLRNCRGWLIGYCITNGLLRFGCLSLTGLLNPQLLFLESCECATAGSGNGGGQGGADRGGTKLQSPSDLATRKGMGSVGTSLTQ